MRLSVAMPIYNGAEYVGEQMESLAAQSRPPDELVVCDDNSSDDSVEIIAAFAGEAPFPVILHENSENLGYARNAKKAVGHCGGEVVFLCDHDDVWLPEKVGMYEEAFSARPDVGGVFSNAEVVDKDLRLTGRDLWRTANFNPGRRRRFEGFPFEVLLGGNVAYGPTLAFRRSLAEPAKPFPPSWDADEWISLFVAVSSKFHVFDEPLVKYRQHASNLVGAKGGGTIKENVGRARSGSRLAFYSELAEHYSLLQRRLTEAPGLARDPEDLGRLREKIEHSRFRAELGGPFPRRLSGVLRELMSARYHRYSGGVKSAAKDALFRGSDSA
ncbi:MAG: glycosyltransferase family 2 protein [Actinomycetota bacterium]|nr:glycosyltransferase family 2 protein [Rubrobacter sp.]MDQ3509348.1 glycosyltransferase family 2 protein [Actinomycetota bacterium]